MKLKFFSLSVLFLWSAFFGLEAKIIETSRIEEIQSFVDEKTWIFVDLDNCLFEAKQALGHAFWFYDEVSQRMEKGMTREEAIKDFYPSWVEVQPFTEVQPVDDNFFSLLRSFQKKNIIMGLTHRQPSCAKSTFRQVNSLKFDFIKTAPDKTDFILPANDPILYSHGILFVGDYNKKGNIFQKFLAKIKQKPQKIVFIDDSRKNVEELETLFAHDLTCLGVHYTAIAHKKSVFDRKTAAEQYELLKKTKIKPNQAVF